jgi:hypothetical protein
MTPITTPSITGIAPNSAMKKQKPQDDEALLLDKLMQRFEQSRNSRFKWEPLWQECYNFVLPQRGGFDGFDNAGRTRMETIFDATAMDAADQLAASLLGNLTPIWSQWFGLKPGPELSAVEAEALAPVLERAAKTIQDHFDRSNFAVEIHQCYLDLIIGGTASLCFEESDPGSFSAFRFHAVPLADIYLEEGVSGVLDGTYRILNMTLAQLSDRYPLAVMSLPPRLIKQGEKEPQTRFKVMESVLPDALGTFTMTAVLTETGQEPQILEQTRLPASPVINFRWLKGPGEIYGRSPIMKSLPDIKTANKVVELILKNASIAVTGVWQADDDGVLNPANIQLQPGSIIPKAVGSKGLQPLEMPGRFDVSELMLDSLRSRIRHSLLTDRLGPVMGPRMTATEVIERSAEMSLLLGATYGRLQSELLTPLIKRAFAILRRRGEVPDIALDGRLVAVDYRSPLARSQGQRNVQNTLSWINSVLAMGPEAAQAVDLARAARFLGEALGVPSDLIRNEVDLALPPQPQPLDPLAQSLSQPIVNPSSQEEIFDDTTETTL